MAEGCKAYLPNQHISNSEPIDGEDTSEVEGEGAKVEKNMDKDGKGPVEADKSSEETEGTQLENTIITHPLSTFDDQETLEQDVSQVLV